MPSYSSASGYPHTPNTHTRRLLVVGAGPAGLAAAHFLKTKGYQDITVVDAKAQPGGKTISHTTRGAAFDLGATFAHYGYVTVRELAEHYGIAMKPAPALVRATAQGAAGRLGLPARYDLKTGEALLRLGGLLVEHRGLWNPGFLRFSAELALSIPEWIEKHQLAPLNSVLLPAFAGYGFGDVADKPAASLLKMVYRMVARNAFDNARWMQKIWQLNAWQEWQKLFDPLMFRDGFDSLCDAIAAEFAPRCHQPVTAVRGDERGVSVALGGQDERYDAVIMAVAPSVVARIVDDPLVSDVFSLTRHETLHSLLLEVDGFPEHQSWFMHDMALAHQSGHLVRISDLNPGSGVCNVLACSHNDVVDMTVLNHVRQAMTGMGLKAGKLIRQQQWESAGYANAENFLEFHDRVESLQGLNGVYFTGETMDSASVEGAMAYSRFLVDRFF